jgi:hypothetical protein
MKIFYGNRNLGAFYRLIKREWKFSPEIGYKADLGFFLENITQDKL